MSKILSFTLSLLTVVLLLAGGLVTSTDSGLSVPDWPLSYGQFFPPMVGGILFEHSHRIIAGLILILTFVLMVAVLIQDSRRWMKQLTVFAFFLVIIQALLGGLTVIYLLPTAISVLHACIAQTFFVLICALALFSTNIWQSPQQIITNQCKKVRRMAITTFSLTYAQLILGAIVRHTEGAFVLVHIAIGVVVLIHIHLLSRLSQSYILNAKPMVTISHCLSVGVLIQIFLGLGAYIQTLVIAPSASPRLQEVFLTTLHQTLGAVLLALMMLYILLSFRCLQSPQSEKTN